MISRSTTEHVDQLRPARQHYARSRTLPARRRGLGRGTLEPGVYLARKGLGYISTGVSQTWRYTAARVYR